MSEKGKAEDACSKNHLQLDDEVVVEMIEEDEEEEEERTCWLVIPPSLWGWGRWHGSIVYLHWTSVFHAKADELDQTALHDALAEGLLRWRQSGLHHPRLMDYYGLYWAPQPKRKPKRLSLVMDSEGTGEPELETLRERATRDPNLTQYETAIILRDLASVMSYAHSRSGNWHGRLHANDVIVYSAWNQNGYCQVQNVKVPYWGLFACVRNLVKDNSAPPLDGSDIRSLGLLGLECYMGRKAIPDSDKYISNMQYMDRKDELNAIICMCLTKPIKDLPSAAELTKRLDEVALNKKEKEDYYFDALYGTPRNPQEKIEQLEGRLKMAQENVDELEDEMRVLKEEYDDLDHAYDRSIQFQASVMTERDDLKKEMDEIKAARRRRDHPFSFLAEGVPWRSSSLFSDLFRSSPRFQSGGNPFSGLFGDPDGMSSSPWGSGLFGRQSSRSENSYENTKRQDMSALLKQTMDDTRKGWGTSQPLAIEGPNDGDDGQSASKVESFLESFPQKGGSPTQNDDDVCTVPTQSEKVENGDFLSSGNQLADDLIKSLPS